jgi:hypothetical protein
LRATCEEDAVADAKISEATLDEKRKQGDQRADAVIAELVRDRDTTAVNELMSTLVDNEGIPAASLPPIVAQYLNQSAKTVLTADRARMAAAENLFGLYGPEVLMVLGMYSLPMDFASRKGVHVLGGTGSFAKAPMRRVWETAQFVIDVMGGGGLTGAGKGLRTAQKVRLMHAAIRHLIRKGPKPWNEADLGVPINQEDLAGTLMSFSYVVLEGLRRLGVSFQPGERDSYVYAWGIVGEVMGVDRDLIPATFEDAASLSRTIVARQIKRYGEGADLVSALIKGFDGLSFLGISFAPTVMRFFLEQEPISGRDVANLLKIPSANWTRLLLPLLGLLNRIESESVENRLVARGVRRLKFKLVEQLLRAERGPGRPPFCIPQHLQYSWRGNQTSAPTPRR